MSLRGLLAYGDDDETSENGKYYNVYRTLQFDFIYLLTQGGSGRSSLRNSTEGTVSLFSIVDYGTDEGAHNEEEGHGSDRAEQQHQEPLLIDGERSEEIIINNQVLAEVQQYYLKLTTELVSKEKEQLSDSKGGMIEINDIPIQLVCHSCRSFN